MIYGLVIIIIFNWRSLVNISKYKLILPVIAFIAFLGFYEILRANLSQGAGLYELPSVMDRLNRTSPVNYLQLIEMKAVSHSLFDMIKMWLLPIPALLEIIGLNFDGTIDTSFNLIHINEPLFAEYLAWRGTPTYNATGFSISIISYSYLFGQELGVFIFAIFYGFFIATGCKLLDSGIYEQKIVGTALLSGCFLCNESVVESNTLLTYGLIFILFILFLAFLRRSIINTQRLVVIKNKIS